MANQTTYFDESLINSRLSLRPFYEALKKNMSGAKPGTQKLYAGVMKRFEEYPELLQPITDESVLLPHQEFLEMLLSAIFPLTESGENSLHAVSFPFRFKTVYGSPLFKALFLKPGSHEVNVPPGAIGEELGKEKLKFAYSMILKKYFGYHQPAEYRTIYPFEDAATGLIRYLELNVDPRFVDVVPLAEMPEIPDTVICHRTNRILSLEQLQEIIPLSSFIFEGLAIIRIQDVTAAEVINQIKNSLLTVNAFSDLTVYNSLQTHIRSLIGLADIKIGITPFFKLNGHDIYSDLHNTNSLLFHALTNETQMDDVFRCCNDLFREFDHAVVFPTLTEEDIQQFEYLGLYKKAGVKSMIAAPLKQEGELLGLLEIVSEKENQLSHTHISSILPALPLFTLALEKSAEALDTQVDKVIKEKFTAVQPSVEWKFTEAALRYIVARQQDENAGMERIAFDQVYPLYGAIDIRNSSTERAHSIQLDLIEQLQMARAIVKKAHGAIFFPLLEEIAFKIDKYVASASDILLSEEEIAIHDFLQDKVIALFDHLLVTVPEVRKNIESYYQALDPQLKMIYHHRRHYEESITKVNEVVARFIDKEQVAAQKVFPHYFERYVTDGVEFNIYIGQSIAPKRKFDDLYLRNMKMWQLTTLTKAAQLTRGMEASLSHPLQTTQLILAHSIPLSISFRTAERKFDVEGAYNIRYEIIKKRIDKVRIKQSGERLTQPGRIAIVFSQPREAAEYKEYIEFLQNQGILKAGLEELELEELQGVVGLKALRVEVSDDTVEKPLSTIELSQTTTDQLLGKKE